MGDPKPATPLPWKWSNKLPCIWLGANDAPVGGLMDPDHPAKDSDMAYALHAANSLPALQDRVGELERICEDLAMMVRRFISRAKNGKDIAPLIPLANNYLMETGLHGSILREMNND